MSWNFFCIQKKLKILVLYADSSYPRRKTVSTFLESFQKYLPYHTVYYHNTIFNKLPLLRYIRKADLVIFHHSITTVWNRKTYTNKIDTFSKCNFYGAVKIALMQDEYKNIDLLQEMIQRLKLDTIYSVAPGSEWETIYGKNIVKKNIIKPSLTGYINKQNSIIPHINNKRDIDIGYRGDWSPQHTKLGRLGLHKKEFPEFVQKEDYSNNLNLNIKLGSRHFLNGNKWYEFLKRCRFVIGVPSGSSVIDPTGKIEEKLKKAISDGEDDEKILYSQYVKKNDNSINLSVLSPRHFEAAMLGCAQILIKGEYNGILKPWIHYLPVEEDYSNLTEILKISKSESIRLKLVENCYRDLVDNPKYTYQHFVQTLISENIPKDTFAQPFFGHITFKLINSSAELIKIFLIIFINTIKR